MPEFSFWQNANDIMEIPREFKRKSLPDKPIEVPTRALEPAGLPLWTMVYLIFAAFSLAAYCGGPPNPAPPCFDIWACIRAIWLSYLV